MTTRSGLVFIGATVDSTFRAFETATGEERWSARLPAVRHGDADDLSLAGERPAVRRHRGRAVGPGITKRLSTKIVAYALPR